jgi:hypothetical protein
LGPTEALPFTVHWNARGMLPKAMQITGAYQAHNAFSLGHRTRAGTDTGRVEQKYHVLSVDGHALTATGSLTA